MSEIYYQYEPSAREIAESALKRSGAAKTIPKNLLPLVIEVAVDAAHDAIEFGESIAALPTNQRPEGEIWMDGLLEGLSIRDEEGKEDFYGDDN